MAGDRAATSIGFNPFSKSREGALWRKSWQANHYCQLAGQAAEAV